MKGGTRTGTRLASVIGPYALAGVFLLAALTKLRDLTGLYQVLESSLGIPTSVVYPLGQFVVAAEILVVLALVLPHYRTLGFIGAGILSAAFLAFSAYRLLKDQTSPCHCFGDLIHLSPLQSCGLNVVILFASCWMLVVRLKASRDGRTSNPDAQFLAGFLAILGSASVAIYINRQPHIEPLMQVSIPKSTLLEDTKDFAGSSKTNTVVMFGDYQCPPCKAASKVLSSMLKHEPARFRIAFRNFPLTKIHPFAKKGALVAEQARLQGKFWAVHDAMYTVASLNDQSIASVAKKYGVSNVDKGSFEAVEADILVAKQLGLDSTPSFIFIDRHGDCWKTTSVNSVLSHMH